MPRAGSALVICGSFLAAAVPLLVLLVLLILLKTYINEHDDMVSYHSIDGVIRRNLHTWTNTWLESVLCNVCKHVLLHRKRIIL